MGKVLPKCGECGKPTPVSVNGEPICYACHCKQLGRPVPEPDVKKTDKPKAKRKPKAQAGKKK